MKLGYSMLSGEHIHSEEIDYTDCKDLQIVCPACKEPVFKVVRATIPAIHYLSHYEKDKVYEEECRLRVANIRSDDIASYNATSRGQRLEYFLSVLKGAIIKTLHGDSQKIDSWLKKSMNRPGPQMFFERCLLPAMRHFISSGLAGFLVDETLEFEAKHGHRPNTGLIVSTVKRIAKDVLSHVFTSHARGNAIVLYGTAYLYLMGSFASFKHEDSFYPAASQMAETLYIWQTCGRENADVLFYELLHTDIGPPFVQETMPLSGKMASEIEHEMVRRLSWIPYLELLKKKYGGVEL